MLLGRLLCCFYPISPQQRCNGTLNHTISRCDFHGRRVVEWFIEPAASSNNTAECRGFSGKETIECDHVAWSSGENLQQQGILFLFIFFAFLNFWRSFLFFFRALLLVSDFVFVVDSIFVGIVGQYQRGLRR